MTLHGRLVCGIGAVVMLATQAMLPGALFAKDRAASPSALQAKIVKTFPWAVPKLLPRTADGKQFSLSIFEKGSKPPSLEQGTGATLLNLYLKELPNQPVYYLTTYSVAQNGAPLWQYIYTPPLKRLVRYHFITARPTNVAIWTISLAGIAKAAKDGHWPAPTNH